LNFNSIYIHILYEVTNAIFLGCDALSLLHLLETWRIGW
jgi:hypothetical protein